MKITWKGVNEVDGQPVNFSAVLFSDGRIRFDYEAGNSGLTPTVGLSMGDGQHVLKLAGYDGAAALAGAKSVQFGLVPGFADAGAYEFRGSSLDVTPPTVTATVPGEVGSGGTVVASIGQLRMIGLTFSEAINSIDARATGNFKLTGAGADGIFGTADDFDVTAVPTYLGGDRLISLNLANGYPATGIYRIAVFGSALTSVHDLSGIRLDGDANGTAGGDYVRTFTVAAESVAPTVTSVWVAGSRWSSAFRNALSAESLGSAIYGFAITGGADQVKSLPWSNLDRITIRFSEAVAVAADYLSISGVNVTDYGISAFSYDSATFTATWTLARSPRADRLGFQLDGGANGVRDLAGNRLDGEWANPTAARPAGDAFPSGNGTPGGNFPLALSSLAGDVDRDGRVTASDVLQLRRRLAALSTGGRGSVTYSVFCDLNGDGRVNASDLALVRANTGRTLPTPSAGTPASATAAATVQRPTAEPSRRSVWEEVQIAGRA